MSLVLVTREELENRSLAHYRTPGSKNGERLYQYKDGSLTPLGRIHYGVGLGRDRSGTSTIIGKKQVNSDGSLTKRGTQAVEDTTKDGGYLNPSKKEIESGHAAERQKIKKAFEDETHERVEEPDPYDDERHKIEEEIWNKYKDKYAEATLKDLGFPVNEKNKNSVKDAFKRYDASYDSFDADNEGHLEEHMKSVQDNRDKRFGTKLSEKTDKEIKKDVEEKVENVNKTLKEKAQERAAANKERNDKLKDEIREIRTLADEDLNNRIVRLQKEKQLAELLNERNNREQSEFHRRASKIFKDAAENLAKRALNEATDGLLKKYRDRMNQNVQGSQNKKAEETSKPADDSSKPKDNTNTPSNNGGGGKFSKPEKSQIRSMAGAGKSVAEIAKALGTTEDRVKGYMSAAGITIS